MSFSPIAVMNALNGNGPWVLDQEIEYGSTTFQPTADSWYIVTLIGAGGGGGAAGRDATNSIVMAQGGNSGGAVQDILYFEAGQTYTFIVGDGGAGGTCNGGTSTYSASGGTGGNTTISGGNLGGTLTAYGGLGGDASRVANGGTTHSSIGHAVKTPRPTGLVLSDSGRIGQGGCGGSIDYTSTSAVGTGTGGPSMATGGGAANVMFIDALYPDGGSILITQGIGYNKQFASGGGGTGGRGGHANMTINSTNTSTYYIHGGGGGAGGVGTSVDYTAAQSYAGAAGPARNYTAATLGYQPRPFESGLLWPVSAGTAGKGSATTGDASSYGGGVGGWSEVAADVVTAGRFGGGSGVIGTNTTAFPKCHGGIGGGGGGTAIQANIGTNSFSAGNGGNGLIILQRIRRAMR